MKGYCSARHEKVAVLVCVCRGGGGGGVVYLFILFYQGLLPYNILTLWNYKVWYGIKRNTRQLLNDSTIAITKSARHMA